MEKTLKNSPWAMLVPALIGTLIGTMGNSMVSIALPSLVNAFSVSLSTAAWSITVYTLTFSVFIPVFGTVGPALGYKRIFTGGMLLVFLSSILCIVAPTYSLFLFARVLLGVGVATILPTIMGIIANRLPSEVQGQATGYWAFVNGFGHAVGPSLGGLLLQHFSWHSIFIVNLPLSLASIILAFKILPADRRVGLESFDFAGVCGLMAFSFCALFSITQVAKYGLESWVSVALLSGALIALVFLIIYEKRQARPFVDLGLFKNIRYVSSIMPISLQAFTQFGLLVSLPFFLIDIQKIDDQTAGLIIMGMTLTMALLGPVSGWLSDRLGCKWVSLLGTSAIIVSSLTFISRGDISLPGWGMAFFLARLLLFGAGFALIQSSATVAVIKAVPAEKSGAATGFFHMFRFTSASLGSTIIGIMLELNASGMLAGLHASFWVFLGLALFTLPFTFYLPGKANVQPETSLSRAG